MGNSLEVVSWRDKLISRKAASPAYWGQPPKLIPNRLFTWMGLNYNYGDWNTRRYMTEGYAGNAALYAIINAIAKKCAIAPFKVYKIKNKTKHYRYKSWTGADATHDSLQRAMMLKELVYEEDSNHPLNALLEKPNKWQKGNEFVVNSVGYKLLTGNRFLTTTVLDIGANRGNVAEVINLPPQLMAIKGDGTLYGVSEYVLKIDGQDKSYQPEEIIHSKYFNPLFDSQGGHLWGLSPLRAACKNITRSDSGINRSVAMLQNAGAAGLIFDKGTSDMTAEQALQFKEKINEEVLGSDNSGRIAVANGDMGYINFGLTAVEMNILEMEKYSMEQLCNIYSVPPGLFNPDKMSLNNSKEFKKDLITGAVLPELASLRDDLNDIAAIYKDSSIYVDYDISVYPELQEDQEKLTTQLAQAWWFKGNEKRVAQGQDEDSDEPLMDSYMIPNNLTPIQQLSDNMQQMQDQMNQVDQQMNGNLPDANVNGQQNGQRNGKPVTSN